MAKKVHYQTTNIEVWSDTAVDAQAVLHISNKVGGRQVGVVLVKTSGEATKCLTRAQLIADKGQSLIDTPPTDPNPVDGKAGIDLLPTV